MHGDRRVAVRLKFMEMADTRSVIYTEYDPGLVLEEHGHSSDHVIFVTKGSLRIGDVECAPGMMVLLEHGASFGPLVTGPDGAQLIEFYTGDITPVPTDPEAYERAVGQPGHRPGSLGPRTRYVIRPGQVSLGPRRDT